LAALTGLVVVAISINLTRILSIAQLPRRAGESLFLLVGAIVLASVALVPNQPGTLLGVEIAAVGLVMLAAPLAIQISSRNLDAAVSPAKRSARAAVTVAAGAPFLIAGVLLYGGSNAGLYWAAAGVIISLVGGVWNTWILLVEILR
jgi:hypothetical protein